jgi:integrase
MAVDISLTSTVTLDHVGSTRARVDKDGKTRYVALYRDLRGRQRSAGTFTSEKQADKAWQRAEALVESGRLGDLRRGRQTFRHYVEKVWLPGHQIEASTRERYTYMIGKHLMPELGAMRMIDILPEHIRDWIAGQKAIGLSASTIAGNKTILSAIFTTALNDQVVFLHPCAGVKTPTVARKPRVIVTPAQYDVIQQALPGNTTRLLVETAIESGLRWGELTELRPADLDLYSRMLTVSRAVTETTAPADGTRFAVKAYPKDKEYRRLKLSAAVCTSLRNYIAHNKLDRADLLFPLSLLDADTGQHRAEATAALEAAAEPTGRTEPSDRGRTYPHGTLTAYTLGKCRCPHCKRAFATYRADRRAAGKDNPRGTRIVNTDGHLPRRWFRHHIWTPATRAAQLPTTVRFHDLRHAHASWLLAGGADIQTVKERLGHGSLRTTEKYLHTLPDTDETALDALERVRKRTAK